MKIEILFKSFARKVRNSPISRFWVHRFKWRCRRIFVPDQLDQLAIQVRDYKMNEKIDINLLATGTYFLAINRGNENVKSEKLIQID